MKNSTTKKTRKNNRRNYPSDKSRWAYMMQAIEPNNSAINATFPDFHPQWLQMSQLYRVAPDLFIALRKNTGMNIEQCAAYLRVAPKTVYTWESGTARIPFAAVEVLRLIPETVRFKMSNKEWDGWFISDKGMLVSPNIGGNGFTPEQLDWFAWQGTEANNLQREVNRLQRELEAAYGENTRLRQMFVDQGVVDELHDMHGRMNELIQQIATAKIFQFNAIETATKLERVA